MAAAVDLLDLIREHSGGQFERKSRTRGGEYAGPCPWCGGRDRFQIWPGDEFPHYWCRDCGKWGGVARFLVEKCDISWEDARRVETEGLNVADARKRVDERREDATPASVAGAPCLEWQMQALTLMRLAQAALNNERIDPRVLRYLTGKRRGLAPETIRQRHLGYIPQDRFFDPREWGLRPSRDLKKVFIPRGILIPYESAGQIWRLKVRRLTDEKARRFLDVTGGSNALYGAEALAECPDATLSESEFDAMIAAQNAPGIAHCATGGTDGAREDRWIARLAIARAVLVTYDPDAGGDERAAWWLAHLPNAARYRPVGGDLTHMHLAGQPGLGPWLMTGIERAHTALAARAGSTAPTAVRAAPPAPVPPPSAPGECFWCKREGAALYDAYDRPWCGQHAPNGAINRQTGEVHAARDMSARWGTCYWCGSTPALIDTHGRPWCAAHLPGVFDGAKPSEEDVPLPEEAEARNTEIVQGLRAALVEAGAIYDAEPTPARAKAATTLRALPQAPGCVRPACRGVGLTTDCLGNLWCANCAPRRAMIDAGAQSAQGWFPDLAWGTTQRTGAGDAQWMRLALTLSVSACHMVERAARGEPSILPFVTPAPIPQEARA